MEKIEELTVNEVVRRVPEAVAVFGRFGIDSCCGGNLEVAEAARRHQVGLKELLEALKEAGATTEEASPAG